jgi:hypothetical protein
MPGPPRSSEAAAPLVPRTPPSQQGGPAVVLAEHDAARFGCSNRGLSWVCT